MTIAMILEGKGAEVVTINGDARVGEAVALLGGRRIGAVVVMDGEKVAGILSERDVVYCLTSDGAEVLDWPVSRVMTAPPITIRPTHSVLAGLSMMTERRIRHLPVVDEGRLVGLVSIGDLVKFRIDRIEAEAKAMREYIQTA